MGKEDGLHWPTGQGGWVHVRDSRTKRKGGRAARVPPAFVFGRRYFASIVTSAVMFQRIRASNWPGFTVTR